MIAQLSDVRLVSELPQKWRRDKVSRLCDFIGSGGTPPTGNPDFYDGDIPWVQTGDLNDDRLERTAKTITEEGLKHSAARLYPSETLLVAMYGATIGKLGILKFSAAVNQACCALVVRKTMSMRFMFYTLRSMRSDLIAEAIGGGQQNIGQETIKQTYILFPPLPEQQCIVAYLDASCTAIDVAVAAKRRQLESLDALRKTTVHRAITQGLNHDAKMKSAGIPWLANVPAHWVASRIKNVAKLSPGYSGSNPSNDEMCTVVPMECLSNAGTVEIEAPQLFEDVSSGFTFFENGDVLFAKITPCMENGKGAFIASLPTRYAFGSTEFHVLRPGKAVNGEFLYYFTYNPIFRAYAAENMSGAAGQKRVSSRFLKETRLFLPPLNEQMEIVLYIKTKDCEFRALFAQIEQQIEMLVNYRKSLIHECVTGQRRVTEADINRVKAHG